MRRRAFTAAALPWLSGCATEPAVWMPLPGEAVGSPKPASAAGPGAGAQADAASVQAAPDRSSAAAARTPSTGVDAVPPPPPREFRGAWVASVANIDWPSRPGLPPAAQRAEALAILDRARSLNLNALILQVRPAGDALYPSALEPWSEYLTGEQGRAPAPLYDPLAFWIAQAHLRGLELHAWFNPYRARHPSARTPLAPPHLAVRQPTLARRYGDMWWMDPGEPAAMQQTLAVVADVVRRYDIDGVHIDDYFYPYPIKSGDVEVPFPDDASHKRWPRYGSDGAPLARADWRRANVDALVNALYRTVHQIKPWVQVGISPFGIGRPGRRAPGISGFSQYDKLHADVERWLEQGWLDYLAPQLYWPIMREGQQFPVLLDGWVAENIRSRHLWPGLYTSQVKNGQATAWPGQELLDQVALLRTRTATGVGGHIHFSMVALMQDRDGLATNLKAGLYAQPALVPATPWLAGTAPPAPTLRPAGADAVIEPGVTGDVAIGVVKPPLPSAPSPVARWALWRRREGQWTFEMLPAQERRIAVAGAEALVLRAVGRNGKLSEAAIARIPLP
ncbi:MAG: family 10 glycosylhydrolase [Rubrivivax sp.]